MQVHRIRSYQEYVAHRRAMRGEYLRRAAAETALIPRDAAAFTVVGYSYPARRTVDFAVDFRFSALAAVPGVPLWREKLNCPLTGFNNRMRASLQLFDMELAPCDAARVYLTERITGLYTFLAERLGDRLDGSEFLGNASPLGARDERGVRNEDLTRLTYDAESFDRVLSFECLEHVEDHMAALRECYRVLRRSGGLLFSAPFDSAREDHRVRARRGTDGSIQHLLPPEYHPDPVREEGSLCFRHFGWRLLDELREVGFADAYAVLYWSREFGYLGEAEQVQFVAIKR